MSSNLRRGKIPRPTSGVSEHTDQIYSYDGFFGDWVHVFRARNVGYPKSWSSDDIMYAGADTNQLAPSDQADPAGSPMELLRGDGIVVSLSHRSQRMPFAEVNADFHQIRFYHHGDFLLDTELGQLEVHKGDFVLIPKGMIYRESPQISDGNAVFIFETAQPIVLAEELWDAAGFASFFIDYSAMKLPDPVGEIDNVETDVRLKFQGKTHTFTYDFDPCTDVIGWLGDPVLFSLNVWDIPGLGSSHGFLPPPLGAVLMARDKSFFFNVMSPKPLPSVPAPEGSFGPPAHLNDFEELWLNHVGAPGTDGQLWRMPPSLPHPGLKRPPSYPEGPVKRPENMKINVDCRSALTWSDAAREAFVPDPNLSLEKESTGHHIGIDPDDASELVRGREPAAAPREGD